MKKKLDSSQYHSSESYLTEVTKILNIIFRNYQFTNILAACPYQDIKRVNKFLYECAKNSKNPLLIEWSYYSLTSLSIRIISMIP